MSPRPITLWSCTPAAAQQFVALNSGFCLICENYIGAMVCEVQVEVDDVPLQTKDKDEIMESEFFDTRQAFLSLCQGNHYQYDTLRRAKHSSMMVLYHLHNPTAPAFVVTCNMCSHDIEAGQGWRCDICADFDLCNNCKALSNHPHKLTPLTERNAQNKEARQQRVLQVRQIVLLFCIRDRPGLCLWCGPVQRALIRSCLRHKKGSALLGSGMGT